MQTILHRTARIYACNADESSSGALAQRGDERLPMAIPAASNSAAAMPHVSMGRRFHRAAQLSGNRQPSRLSLASIHAATWRPALWARMQMSG